MRRKTFERFYSPEDGGGVLPPPSPAPSPAPAPEPEPRNTGRVTCEGCGCALDTKGKIIMRGEGLKAHLDREDEVRRLTIELDAANASVRDLGTQLAGLKAKERKSILY